ncbi:stimulated by retinoic acid gene 6 -like isoform X1 [Paramuricea clavata]|uniref:Stimulated by retinoic acid gene 6 -like isoform X1 n=1 Tax=Paramuricea clavata TaxID=317549 RepID=A0A7D9LUN3_PARCT|nr:stimulated by retinoic acid gene 6 -like isoform X1 [Paramuricea clavata]
MGFVSTISRILKATAVGALMLPRIDHSIMPGGFQSFDGGFEAYICYLHVQTILSDETRQNRERKWKFSAQARTRWFLALTLARNPQLASDRKPGGVEAPQPVQGGCVKHGDVKIKISRYELRQDK